MRQLILAGTLCLLAAVASAHSRMDATLPQDGDVLAEVPAHVTLDYAQPIRLTKVELSHMGSDPLELELGDQKSFATRFVLPLTGLGPGTYRIEWRGLASDGHVMQGGFSFEVE